MGFDIGLNYSQNCNVEIHELCEKARLKWLSVITDGYVPLEMGGKYFERLEISIDVTYVDGEGPKMAEALHTWEHPDTGLPVNGFIRIDKKDARLPLKDMKLMEEVLIHEMGHVIGMNQYVWHSTGLLKVLDDGRKVLSGPKCSAECGLLFDKTSMDIPLYRLDNFQHIDESSFPNEVMSPGIGESGNVLSKLTAAILDDMGYTVDYSAAEEGLSVGNGSPEFGDHSIFCGIQTLRRHKLDLGLSS